MFGFSLSFFSPFFLFNSNCKVCSIIAWLFNARFVLHFPQNLEVGLQLFGVRLQLIAKTKKYQQFIEQQGDGSVLMSRLAEIGEELAAAIAKMDENEQKSTENVGNATENDKIAAEMRKSRGYQTISHANGIQSIHIENEMGRNMMQGANGLWIIEQITKDTKLVVSDKDHVDETTRSFTLPGYEYANTLEINDVVIFGNRGEHLKAKITGYAESPEGERMYRYQAV